MRLHTVLPSQTNLILVIFLSVIIFTFFNYSIASHHPTVTISNNTSLSYIEECCSHTTYPTLCYTTLSSYAPEIRTNPKLLSTKSLTVALTVARSVSRTMARLSRLRGLRHNEAAALSDCTIAVAHSEAQLMRSIEEMMSRGAHDDEGEMVVSDVETWTSAALTYEEACMEEFGGREMKGNVGIIVRKEIWKLNKLTSNALALVHHFLSKD